MSQRRKTLNRWTEYCSELYNHEANGDPSVLNCTETDTKDDHPILRREVEAAVQSLKKGKSAGVDKIPAGLVKAGGEDVITTLTTICNKICNAVFLADGYTEEKSVPLPTSFYLCVVSAPTQHLIMN